jgi:hypothetical protein
VETKGFASEEQGTLMRFWDILKAFLNFELGLFTLFPFQNFLGPKSHFRLETPRFRSENVAIRWPRGTM